jgi:drug/metabolite transporter (DMT)-like permease
LIALLIGALGIALSPIFVRLSEIGPVATAFWRIGFAMPVVFAWMVLESRSSNPPRRPSSRRDYLRLIWAGLFFAGDLAVWHWSIQFVTLVAWAVFKERFSRTFIGGLALAIGGAVVLMGESMNLSLGHLTGDALGIVTAMFYAGYILSVGRLRAEFSTATIMTWTGLVSGLTLLPLALLSGESLIPPSAYGWTVLAALGVISHAGGQSLIAYALAHLPPAFSSVSLLLQPAAASIFAWILLSEPLGFLQALGAAIVLAGIFLARRGSR